MVTATSFGTRVVKHWPERETDQRVHQVYPLEDVGSLRPYTIVPLRQLICGSATGCTMSGRSTTNFISLLLSSNHVRCNECEHIQRGQLSTYRHLLILTDKESSCSTVVLMVRWIVGSILHGGPIVLFLVPARAPRIN